MRTTWQDGRTEMIPEWPKGKDRQESHARWSWGCPSLAVDMTFATATYLNEVEPRGAAPAEQGTIMLYMADFASPVLEIVGSSKTSAICTLLLQIFMLNYPTSSLLPCLKLSVAPVFPTFLFLTCRSWIREVSLNSHILPSSSFPFCHVIYLTIPCSAKRKEEIIQLDY